MHEQSSKFEQDIMVQQILFARIQSKFSRNHDVELTFTPHRGLARLRGFGLAEKNFML